MTREITVSALSAFVALASFVVALVAERRSRRNDAYAQMPVLVSSAISPTSLILSNVGNGPALNIAVAATGGLDGVDAQEVKAAQLRSTRWTNAAHLQPIGAGETCTVRWGGASAIGLLYTDAFGRWYTTLASTSGTKSFAGRLVPGVRLRDLAYADRT